MPFVHVRTARPASDPREGAAAVRVALARDAGIEEQHVAVTWQAVDAVAGAPSTTIEILAPDFHPPERVEAMLRSAARSVAHAIGVDPSDVMASYREARSGQVLDGGEIVRW